jgi:hypothetical protein
MLQMGSVEQAKAEVLKRQCAQLTLFHAHFDSVKIRRHIWIVYEITRCKHNNSFEWVTDP